MRNWFVAAVLLTAMLGFVALALSEITSLPHSPVTRAQLPVPTSTPMPTPTSRFEYDVLPGVGATGATPMDVRMTSGWHFSALDLGAAQGTAVHAVFRVVKSNQYVSAYVKEIVDEGNDCREVIVKIQYKEEGKKKENLGELRYVHIIPQVSEGDTIPLTGDSHPKKIGEVIYYKDDGMECPTTGDHLHQGADLSLDTSLWRNFDRTGYEDDGLGFDPPVLGYDASEKSFCSDIWIFKLVEATPVPTPIERCGAPDNAPGNLAADGGDGRIDLTWSTPAGNITGYEVRWRLGTPASNDKAPWIAEKITTADSRYATKIEEYQETYGWKAIPGSASSTTRRSRPSSRAGTS